MNVEHLVTILTGPGAALIVLVLGGRWLMRRIEVRESAYDVLLKDVTQVIRDNTAAMATVRDALMTCTARPTRLSDPNIPVAPINQTNLR